MKLLAIVLLNWLISKILKTIADSWKNGGAFGKKGIFTNGGIPSSHTVLVISAATAIFLEEGLTSIFLVSIVLALIVSYDAFTIRRTIEMQSRTLLRLCHEEQQECVLETNFGHNFMEVAAGVIQGVALTVLFYAVF